MAKKLLALIGTGLATVYILNPGFGAFELLPDVLPVIGNLDEATATAILLWGVKTLFKKDDLKEVEDILNKKKD